MTPTSFIFGSRTVGKGSGEDHEKTGKPLEGFGAFRHVGAFGAQRLGLGFLGWYLQLVRFLKQIGNTIDFFGW